ncbi:hypothetical protein [Wolbachia endosymbiont of Folsomia candida]|uniref:hypothetical protein n=1 Tax=Wolbachia endosymbiont of Folsomia candida TaxID=169402 RepID=UPI000A844E7E|nr:hypothetical protein [Wolbachia endosymbiont of Folsomia candida]APR99191.2 hypothetical protein ASM33_04240 [Wolbachia endosymbiont of Folsomia candida]
MTTEYEDTKVKSTSQKTGENNVKPPIHNPKKPLRPIFDDEKYGIKSPRIEQHSQQREQGHLKSRSLLKSIPIIGGFLARAFTSKKIEIISNPIYDNMETYKESQSERASKVKDVAKTTKTDAIGSKLEEGSVEKASNKKDHSRTK